MRLWERRKSKVENREEKGQRRGAGDTESRRGKKEFTTVATEGAEGTENLALASTERRDRSGDRRSEEGGVKPPLHQGIRGYN